MQSRISEAIGWREKHDNDVVSHDPIKETYSTIKEAFFLYTHYLYLQRLWITDRLVLYFYSELNAELLSLVEDSVNHIFKQLWHK